MTSSASLIPYTQTCVLRDRKARLSLQRELPGTATATVTVAPLETCDNEPRACEGGTSGPEVRALLSQAKRSNAD